MTNQTTANWTPQRIEILTARVKDGTIYSVIASELGITRNAAIGKAKRLGLTGERGRGRWTPAARAGGFVRRPAQKAKRPALAPAPIQPIPLDAPPALGVNLLDLRPRHCRWPYGDPRSADFHFCGHEAPIDKPYCAFHVQAALSPPLRRRAA